MARIPEVKKQKARNTHKQRGFGGTQCLIRNRRAVSEWRTPCRRDSSLSLKKDIRPSRRVVQRKFFHDALDYSVLGRRIGAQPFFEAAKKTQQLAYDHVNRGTVLVTQLSEAGALDGDIPVP